MTALTHADRSAPLPETLMLGAHVRACDRARHRSFGLMCAAERAHDLLGPRLITVVLSVTALLAVLSASV
jgi:hypothetical protein